MRGWVSLSFNGIPIGFYAPNWFSELLVYQQQLPDRVCLTMIPRRPELGYGEDGSSGSRYFMYFQASGGRVTMFGNCPSSPQLTVSPCSEPR
jgi:hypothetical protein